MNANDKRGMTAGESRKAWKTPKVTTSEIARKTAKDYTSASAESKVPSTTTYS